jgi:hypothetical protein
VRGEQGEAREANGCLRAADWRISNSWHRPEEREKYLEVAGALGPSAGLCGRVDGEDIQQGGLVWRSCGKAAQQVAGE